MSSDDLTVSILREIRDELRATRGDLSAQIGETNARLGETNERLGVVEVTLRDFATQHLMLTRYVKHSVDRHGTAIDDLEDRVSTLEAGAGSSTK